MLQMKVTIDGVLELSWGESWGARGGKLPGQAGTPMSAAINMNNL